MTAGDVPGLTNEQAIRLLAAIDFVGDPLSSQPVPQWAEDCDCPHIGAADGMRVRHRWNCTLTPIWAQTMRDLDCNPWTVIRPRDQAISIRVNRF